LTTDEGATTFPFWPTTPVPGYLGQLEEPCQRIYASSRSGLTLDDCDFYHTSVLNDGSVIQGAWDHRGTERAYLGNLQFNGRRVLELGPATGHFTFFLEHNGADVVSFEVGYDTSIDLLPPVTQEDIEPLRSTLMTQLERVNKSWWYLHQDREISMNCHRTWDHSMIHLSEVFCSTCRTHSLLYSKRAAIPQNE
jgi:hypothetical protein